MVGAFVGIVIAGITAVVFVEVVDCVLDELEELEVTCEEVLLVEDDVWVELVEKEGEDDVLVIVTELVVVVVEAIAEVVVGVLVVLLVVLLVDVEVPAVVLLVEAENAPYAATTASARMTTPTATYFVATPYLSFRVRFISKISRYHYR